MRAQAAMWPIVFTLITCGQALGGDSGSHEPADKPFMQRLHPAGGWSPYGGGLLHWWNPHCFPRCGAPDDYCRKPLPRLCWRPYLPSYTYGPPEICYPPCDTRRDWNKTQ